MAGSRISLDSVVYAFNRGDSPRQIPEGYPLLGSLSRIDGAIAFYLDHQAAIDKYLEERALWEKLQRARAKTGEPRAGANPPTTSALPPDPA